ncbi:mitochondrial processing peptidase-like protein [alpha proteobacterium U9-1i]|nr:mitochondrial processing peptidase-like protein [alpha proteobacterium U9-1i]
MSELELRTLPNGVRVALDPMPGIGTAALGVWQRVGARWEPAAINGVAHLFEHMAFKGAGSRDARQFAEAIENVGGVVNAATSYERTSYYARVLAEHAPMALDMLADIVLAPHWNADDLEKEKGVVAQERGEAFDVPDDRVFELHQAALYPDQPLGRPILGEEASLANVSIETLEAFREAHLAPERVIISIAGAFNREVFLDAAQRRFGAIAAKPAQERAPARAVAGVAKEARKLEQAHVVFSWPAPAAGSSDGFAVRLLSEIFGGGMASRLFQEVRETRGLVYTIDSFLDTFEDDGRLCVYAGCTAANAPAVAEIVRAELAAIAATGVTTAELARAKAIARAQLLMGLEAPSSRAGARAAQAFLYGRLIPETEIVARIEAVTPEAIRALAAKALAGPGCVAVIGPKAGHGAIEAFQAHS